MAARPKSAKSLPLDARTLPMVKRIVLDYMVRHWQRIALAFILLAIVSVCTAAVPFILKELLDSAFGGSAAPENAWLTRAIAGMFSPDPRFNQLYFIALATAAVFLVKGSAGLRGGDHDGLCRPSLDRGHPGQHVRPPDAGRSRVLSQHADRAADLRLHQRRRQDAEPVLEHDYRHRPRYRHGDRAGGGDVLDRLDPVLRHLLRVPAGCRAGLRHRPAHAQSVRQYPDRDGAVHHPAG